MGNKKTSQSAPRAVALILLSCLPLMFLVFFVLPGPPANGPVLTLLNWWQFVMLGVCVALPLLVLPRLGVDWSSDSRQ